MHSPMEAQYLQLEFLSPEQLVGGLVVVRLVVGLAVVGVVPLQLLQQLSITYWFVLQ